MRLLFVDRDLLHLIWCRNPRHIDEERRKFSVVPPNDRNLSNQIAGRVHQSLLYYHRTKKSKVVRVVTSAWSPSPARTPLTRRKKMEEFQVIQLGHNRKVWGSQNVKANTTGTSLPTVIADATFYPTDIIVLSIWTISSSLFCANVAVVAVAAVLSCAKFRHILS